MALLDLTQVERRKTLEALEISFQIHQTKLFFNIVSDTTHASTIQIYDHLYAFFAFENWSGKHCIFVYQRQNINQNYGSNFWDQSDCR